MTILLMGCSSKVIRLHKKDENVQHTIALKSDDATAYFETKLVIRQIREYASRSRDLRMSREADSLNALMRQHSADTLEFSIEFELNTSAESQFVSYTSAHWIASMLDRGLVSVISNRTGRFIDKLLRKRMRDNFLYYLQSGEVLYYDVRSL